MRRNMPDGCYDNPETACREIYYQGIKLSSREKSGTMHPQWGWFPAGPNAVLELEPDGRGCSLCQHRKQVEICAGCTLGSDGYGVNFQLAVGPRG